MRYGDYEYHSLFTGKYGKADVRILHKMNALQDTFDPYSAYILCLDRAREGDVFAKLMLVVFYENGYGSKDPSELVISPEEGFTITKELAEQGNPIALAWMVYQYRSGKYVNKDDNIAKQLLQEALKKPNPATYSVLAQCYCNGILGYGKDEEKALSIYEKALDGEWAYDYWNRFGYYQIGKYYEEGKAGLSKNLTKALEFYKKSASLGYSFATAEIGWFYENGYGGLIKNKQAAFDFYYKAALLGNAYGLTKIGYAYEQKELNQPRDEFSSFMFLKKAVQLIDEAGEPTASGWAEACLGILYKYGLDPNEDKANSQLRKAIQRGWKRSKAEADGIQSPKGSWHVTRAVGSTYDSALETALTELGTSEDRVTVRVIHEPNHKLCFMKSKDDYYELEVAIKGY